MVSPMIVRANATRTLPFRPHIATTAITSPPYPGRRSYGDSPHEIGLEALHEYCRNIVEVGERLKEVLTPTGSWWLNIGDYSCGSGGAGGDYNEGGSKEGQRKYRQGPPTIGLPKRSDQNDLFTGPSVDGWTHDHTRLAPGNWGLAPFHVAMHLQGAGWILRKEIVWDKGNRKPEDLNHVRRPGESHETILFFAQQMSIGKDADKIPGYKYNPDAIPKRRHDNADTIRALPPGTTGRLIKANRGHRLKGTGDVWYGEDAKGNPVAETSLDIAYAGGIMLSVNEEGSVWHVAPGRSASDDGHSAVMPDEIAERCILLSTDEGDVVFDPFAGSGTTIDAAERLNRIGIGTDLYAGIWEN